MDDSAAGSWQRILTWLATHAPRSRAALRGPASAEDLTRTREAMGLGLPAALVAWWKITDGVREDPGRGTAEVIPYGYEPYTIAAALSSRDMWLKIWPRPEGEVGPAGSECLFAWLPEWLPIATNGTGCDLFVDLRPGPLHGRVMNFDNVEGTNTAPA